MEFPDLRGGEKVIIAMKGLPCTGKSQLAEALGKWAGCPVLYIDDFLDTLPLDQEPDYYYNNMGEAKRLHRLAFDGLCKSASRRLRLFKPVVIKSQLRHRFELLKLAQLIGANRQVSRLIIVECRMKNEVRWRGRLDLTLKSSRGEAEWYKPRSWEDIEKARDEEDDGDYSEEEAYLQHNTPVVRMILDPYDDLNIPLWAHHSYYLIGELQPDFIGVMRHLVAAPWEEKLVGVQFAELRRFLAEQKLKATSLGGRSKHFCSTNDDDPNCVFRSTTNGSTVSDDPCGVCQSPINPGEDIYACYFCILTLHKSCAEKTREKTPAAEPGLQVCKSCIDAGKKPRNSWGLWRDCNACKFLRCLVDPCIPIILNHDCHVEHHLSLQLHHRRLHRNCRACGEYIARFGYGCYTCNVYYDSKCAFLPGQVVKHKHGGHEHDVSLMYSHHHEDDDDVSGYWCDSCYKDMDPQNWFYSCQACPYYIAHPLCCAPRPKGIFPGVFFFYNGK